MESKERYGRVQNIELMKIVIFTGAGISAESGISTFRGADGLWENHPIEEVASPGGWLRNPKLVLDFYNQRRRQLFDVAPNPGHLSITELQNHHDVTVITQNVDDLHERAGNRNVIHLHGELRKVRSTVNAEEVLEWTADLSLNDRCSQGYPLRPHIVWFGEAVPMMEVALRVVRDCDVFVIVGTSMQVYPAASLVEYVPQGCSIYYIDPEPNVPSHLQLDIQIIQDRAGVALPTWVEDYIKK